VTGLRIIADHALNGRQGLCTGANEDDWHYTGVSVARDIAVDQWADLREVAAGEACPQCGSPLDIVRCIETGHIFKLGTKYSEAMGASVLDPDGTQRPIVMGSYGIGVERAVAAVAETFHDDRGLQWPISIAPFAAVITVVSVKDEASMTAAEDLYTQIRDHGVDVLLDDRDARAGVKFADAELIGIPFRITIGPKALADGEVEFTDRATGLTDRVGQADVVGHLLAALANQR